jgi:hypothetical protein
VTRKKSRRKVRARGSNRRRINRTARAKARVRAAKGSEAVVQSRSDGWLPPEPAFPPLPAVDDVQEAQAPRLKLDDVQGAPAPRLKPSGVPGWLVAADLGSLVVIAGVMFLNIANTGGVFRLVLALLFVTCVPGWAVVRAAGLSADLTGVAIAVLASLTISAAASTAMVWLNAWHPLMLVAVLAVASAVVILWTLPPAFVAARAGR